MLNDFNNIFHFSITVGEFVESLVVSFFAGLIISFFYRRTYRGPGYLSSFVNSLVILPMVTAVVILVIGNNLARAFGLVGAMSIVRFRTAVKETQDIIYIFFSLAIGMAAGVGLYLVSITGAITIGLVSLLLSKTSIAATAKKDYLLQFTYDVNELNDEQKLNVAIDNYCKRSNLINAKSIGENGRVEYSYNVGFKNKEKGMEFIRALKKLDGVNHVNLYFDEEYF